MAGSETLAQYVARVRWQWIDVDRAFGAQCWDQWSHYATSFLGVPSWPTYTNAGGSSPHSGWACNVHHNARAAGLEKWFEILPASAIPRAGDVAFWELGSAWFPLSHVATVLEVLKGGRMLRCLTQNPGAVQITDLIINGVIGYLRPRALNVGPIDTTKTPTLTASQKNGNEMARFIGAYIGGDKNTPANENSCVIYEPTSGFYTTWGGVDQEYTNEMARTYGTANFNRITKKHWDQTILPQLLIQQKKCA